MLPRPLKPFVGASRLDAAENKNGVLQQGALYPLAFGRALVLHVISKPRDDGFARLAEEPPAPAKHALFVPGSGAHLLEPRSECVQSTLLGYKFMNLTKQQPSSILRESIWTPETLRLQSRALAFTSCLLVAWLERDCWELEKDHQRQKHLKDLARRLRWFVHVACSAMLMYLYAYTYMCMPKCVCIYTYYCLMLFM